MLKALVVSTILLMSSSAMAADAQPRLVTVIGEAEVMAVPDQASINLQVQTFDPDLAKAKDANDEAIRGVLEVVTRHGVDEKDFRTDYFTVQNQEQGYFDEQTNQHRSRRGFFVTKNVSILVRDLSTFETLYSDAMAAGVNNIYGVEFRTSALPQLREESRTLAVQAAKDKAAKLAASLGQELGRPHAIQENPVDGGPQPRLMNVMAMKAESADAAGTIALGQIPVKSSVSVSFELK